MEEINSRRRTNAFKESLKVDTSSYNKRQVRDEGRVSYIGDRIAPMNTRQRINHRRLKQAADMYYSLPQEEKEYIQERRLKLAESKLYNRYGKGKIVDVNREHRRYTGRKKMMSKAMALGLIGAMALGIFGISKGYEAYANSENDKQFEEIAQNDSALEKLGINRETINEIENLQAELSSEDIERLSDEELLMIGNRVENLQMSTIKGKLANVLGVNEEEIRLVPNYSWSANEASTATVIVNKDGEEIIYDTADFLNGDNSISQEITEGILSLGNTQTVNSKIESGDFDKEGAIEQYRSGVDDASKIAIKEMNIDENGNISLEEMDNLIQNGEIVHDDGDER